MPSRTNRLEDLFSYKPRPYQTKYRHAKYAGTMGDVFKHVLLLHSLEVCLESRHKEDRSPFRYRETHSGPGISELGDGGRWLLGIGCLEDKNDLAGVYGGLPDWCSQAVNHRRYHGSWVRVAQHLNASCSSYFLDLWELDPAVVERMVKSCRTLARSDCHHIYGEDGFLALQDNPQRYDLTFLDPPYTVQEQQDDWSATILAVQILLQQGQEFVLWYPRFTESRAQKFCNAVGLPGVELIWDNHRHGKSYRSTGCGMIWSPKLYAKVRRYWFRWQQLADFWAVDLNRRTVSES